MRLGQLTRVAVPGTDLVLLVRVKWGEYRKLIQTISSKSEAEALPEADSFIKRIIVQANGFENEAGEPLEWTPELLDELSPGEVMNILGALSNIGEAGSGLPLPATASAEVSEPPPTPTPADSE